jgi:catechol 2,3-dioxygenase-like lactoylglutathione lyase family enzyme
MSELNAIDHIALPVADIAEAVDWYTRTFQCEVKYQDASWALLGFANVKLALVVPEQHPAHVGLFVENAEKFGKLTMHRDGTQSVYIRDPAGNPIELLAAK